MMNIEITVEEIFDKCFKDKGYIIAGRGGLSRKIKHITVAELPDILDWIGEGELICSTGYFLVDDPVLQRDWILQMSQKGAAGLILKPDRFLGEIPKNMIDLSNANNFPIIIMPLETRWPNLIADVMNVVIAMQSEQINFLNTSHNALLEMLFSMKPADTIIKEISRQSKCLAILVDRFGEVLCSASGSEVSDRLLEEMLHPTTYSILKKEFIQVHNRNENYLTKIEIDGWGTICICIKPIIADIHFFGWILLAKQERKDEDLPMEFIHYSSVILSLSFLNQYAPFILEIQEKSRYIDILSGKINVPEEDFIDTTKMLGLSSDKRTRILIVKQNADISKFLYDQIQILTKNVDKKAIVLLNQNEIVFFIHPDQRLSEERSLAQCIHLIERIAQYWESVEVNWHAGISQTVDHMQDFKDAYCEAALCLKKAERTRQKIVTYDHLGLDKLLALIPDPRKLTRLSDSLLLPLQRYDKKNHTHMQKTLYYFLKNNRNKTLTAQDLYIHQNTLNYRLDRIEKLLNVHLDNVEISTLYYIATEFSRELDDGQENGPETSEEN